MQEKMSRRELLKLTATGIAVCGLSAIEPVSAASQAGHAPSTTKAKAVANVKDVTNRVSPQTYEAVVPDTLDLTERAALAINALTGTADAEHGYEAYLTANLGTHPAYMSHMGGGGVLQGKSIEALAMMRTMSGSRVNLDVDRKMVEWAVSNIDDRGLWWMKTEGRPWNARYYGEDVAWAGQTGRLMVALMAQYGYDQDPRWLKFTGRLADGLDSIVIRKADYAYLPDTPGRPYGGWYFRSGWRTTAEPGSFAGPQVGVALRGIAQYAGLSGDKKAFDLATRMARFMMKPQFWGTTDDSQMVASGEHGHLEGHFHTNTFNVMGLLQYAIVANDIRAKALVKGFYEYVRDFGISRIGFFPYSIGPGPQKNTTAEGCCTADMIWLAVHLSDAGIGDYWEDVDQYARNQMVEFQFTDRRLLEEISAAGPEHKLDPEVQTDDNVIERCVGSFALTAEPTILLPTFTMCCVGNLSTALYFVWESIVRCTNGVAQVNLLLNRASPWLDINSYLPYEGKVVLTNKNASRIHVRIPAWADKKCVRCYVNGRESRLVWLGNYLILESVAKGDMVTITFPMVETTELHTERTFETTYTCRFKGNTLVDISPRLARPAATSFGQDDGSVAVIHAGYPIYQRQRYHSDKAPMKKVTRYVRDQQRIC